MIAISAKSAFIKNRTGLEEYSYQLIKNIIKLSKRNNTLKDIVFYSNKWPEWENDFDDINIEVLRSRYLWSQGRLAWKIFWDKPDIFFNPEQLLPISSPDKSIITVHDLAYERLPIYYTKKQQIYLRFITKGAVKRAKKIIAVSQNTANDLINLYNVPSRKIKVIYHGLPLIDSTDEQIKDDIAIHNLKGSYILYIGRIEIKKNIINLIRGFESFKQKYKKSQLKLILAGKKGFEYQKIKEQIKLSNYFKDIIELDYVDEKTKFALIKRAKALVLPSFYEGFGIPVIEAQNFGIPVITSNISSLPEITSGSAILINPHDAEGIGHAIYNIIYNSKIRKLLIQKGYNNVKKFSWEKTAKETLDLILSLK
ncbi:MAG: glycosyltransferase family 1 protein [Patescibacteria group bacterium]